MPKIILNIEDRIFLSAKELFYEKGYEQANMKEIAKRADLAVGTLYNYFPNKNELYFSVLEKSWNGTVAVTIVFARRKAKLDEILERIQEFHSA